MSSYSNSGVDVLIDAVSHLSNVRLIVAGDGPCRQELEEQARSAGINALFKGNVGPTMRADLLKACDAVVLPSRKLANGRAEGLPLTMIEALASKRPVVATHVADSEKILEQYDCGIVVKPDDPEALSKALQTLRDNQTLSTQLGINGWAFAKTRDWPELILEYEARLGLKSPKHDNPLLSLPNIPYALKSHHFH